MKEQPSLEEYQAIAEEIRKMFNVDQNLRRGALEKGQAVEEGERKSLNTIHVTRMKEIVEQIGWPVISKVGKEVSNMAWLLVQHADHDIEFQKKCLELIKQQPDGEVSKRNIALLEDRVRVNEGRLQLYGTQFFDEGQKYGPRPIENPEQVNDRRKEMGMETLEEYTKIMFEKYKPDYKNG